MLSSLKSEKSLKREDRKKEVKGKENGKGDEGKDKGEYTLVEDMRIELSETERNHSGKIKSNDPSRKKMQIEKKEILERRKLKMNKTSFKDTEDEIRLLEVGDNNTTPLFQNGLDKSVQNDGNNVISYVNKNMSHGDIQSVTAGDDKNNQNNKSDNIQNSDNSSNKNNILLKSKVETFYQMPISSSNSNLDATTKLDEIDLNVRKKAKELELSNVNSIPTPIPSTTIPEINIKNLLPEKILQNNTEAGWNKKDINKKWSMSF